MTADQPEVTAERDARHLAAYKWMFNTSNLPGWYQRAGLGRDFTPIVDGILAAADDPLLDIVRDVLMDYGDACSGEHDDCLCSMNRLRMAYRAARPDQPKDA